MKFTMNREALHHGFTAVLAATAGRTTRPILTNVKALAEDDTLTLTATDLEIGLRVVLRGVQVHQTGEAILGSQLGDILRETHDEEITVKATDDGAEVLVGASRFDIPGYPVKEFPDLPEIEKATGHAEVRASDLTDLIRFTSFAADKKDSTRFALAGTLVVPDGKVLRFAATDSKRLAVCERPMTWFGDQPKGNHLLPQKALTLLSKVLTDGEELVRVVLKPNEAMFQTDRVMIHTRLVEGRYPPYGEIISQTLKQADKVMDLPVGVLLSKVKQAAVMTDNESKRIEWNFAAGTLVMAAKGAETGASRVEMDVDYTGKAGIAFDPQYIVEFLKLLPADVKVRLQMNNGDKPALFGVDESNRYLVMPLSA